MHSLKNGRRISKSTPGCLDRFYPIASADDENLVCKLIVAIIVVVGLHTIVCYKIYFVPVFRKFVPTGYAKTVLGSSSH